MSFTILAGPVGLFSAGAAILLGLIWHFARSREKRTVSAKQIRNKSGETVRLEALVARLESEKASVEAALSRAGETTRRLERLIDSLEATFSPASPRADSVPAIFADLQNGLSRAASDWHVRG